MMRSYSNGASQAQNVSSEVRDSRAHWWLLA
jgi:hypothetical protein